jgi:gas vesicle protein
MAERNGGGEFFAGLVIGGMMGAVLALLMAPQSGQQTRDQLRHASVEIKEHASETLAEAREKAEAITADARRRAEEILNDARKHAEEITSEALKKAEEMQATFSPQSKAS